MASGSDILSAKILIVDDDRYIVSLLDIHLKIAGFSQVRSVTDSRRAIAEYIGFQPDLLILDLVMPHVDGFMILQTLRELKSRAHNILILTSLNDAETRRKAMSAGAKDFLTKPFQRDEAVARITRLLKARKRQGLLSQCNKELEDISRRMNRELNACRKLETEKEQ
ncbi:MAG: response regulator [Thermodesulfobacteriota bacterium]